jgi:hypothetical protein
VSGGPPVPGGEALAAFVDAMAAVMALPIDPGARPGVAGHLARLLAAAALVEELALPDEIEAAPMFRP